MRSVLIISVILVALLSLQGCKDQIMVSSRVADRILLDGFTTDWQQTTRRFFPEEKMSLGIQNDDKFVYFSIRFQNQIQSRQLIEGGFSVEIGGIGEENKGLGYKFRFNNHPMNPPQVFERSQARKVDGFEKPILPMSGVFTAFRLIDDIEDIYYGLNNEDGPAGAFVTDKGIYSFEFRIPLTDMEGVSLWNNIKFSGKILCRLESGSDSPMMAGGGGGGPGGPGGGEHGMDGRPGMGGGPGGRPPDGMGNFQRIKNLKLQIAVFLAQKQ